MGNRAEENRTAGKSLTSSDLPVSLAELAGSWRFLNLPLNLQPAGDGVVREVWPASAAQPKAEHYAKEGLPISLSTLADQVGGCTAALMPLFKRLEAYVLSAERLHGDDTRVSVLAKGKTDTGRIWVYVSDDKPFGGPAPPGAVFCYSPDRAGKHPRAHRPTIPGSSRLTPMTAIASFTRATARLVRSWKQPVGFTAGVRSS